MLTCGVCGRVRDDDLRVCSECRQVADLIRTLAEPVVVVVDGSYADGLGGAGLVLASWNAQGQWIAFCACRFACHSSPAAEYQAIVRATRWAPGAPVFSDEVGQVHRARRQGIDVRWLPPGVRRQPNHRFAHRLATEGRISQNEATLLDRGRAGSGNR